MIKIVFDNSDERKIVYRDNNYSVGFFEGEEKNYNIVLFDTWKDKPNLDDETFGESFLRKHKISYVFVKTAANDWYQGDVKNALSIAKLLTRGRRAIGYGSSMGAYAAINFAVDINIERCICFSPQFSIDRSKVPFETRWASEASKLDFKFDKISDVSGVHCDIIYDPMHDDRKHVDLIGINNVVNHIKIPFGGHNIAELLRNSGQLSSFVISLLLGDHPNVRVIKSNLRIAKRQYANYWVEISQMYFRHNNRDRALAAAKEAVNRKGGDHFLVQTHLANMYLQNGNPIKAIDIYQKYLADENQKEFVKEQLLKCFENNGWNNINKYMFI